MAIKRIDQNDCGSKLQQCNENSNIRGKALVSASEVNFHAGGELQRECPIPATEAE